MDATVFFLRWEASSVSAMVQALQARSLRVIEFSDPAMVIEEILADEPAAILVDDERGSELGRKFLRQVQEVFLHHQLNIIVLTDAESESEIKDLLELGITEIITKPISLPMFCAKIRYVTGRWRRSQLILRSAEKEERTIGPYAILSNLGRGGMGTVYRVRDSRNQSICALKTLRESGPTSDSDRRFRREIQALASIQHPHVVRYIEHGSAQGFSYVALELVDGGNLAERISALGALSIQQSLLIFRHILSALLVIHEKRMLHRDIKPSNILLRSSGEALLSDFGLVKGFQDLRLTAKNQMIGTLQYLAPEVVRGGAFSFSSDLYSLALVILECLSGKPVFPRDNDYLVMDAVAKGTTPSLDTILKERIHELPTILNSVLGRLISFHPKKRFQSAREVLESLAKIPEEFTKSEGTHNLDTKDQQEDGVEA